MPKSIRQILESVQNVEHLMKGRAIGIIGACRGENTPEQNKKNTEELHQSLLSRGHKVIPSFGGYVENKGTPQEKEVNEPSFIVAHKHQGNDKGAILNSITELGKRYKQESVLHKPHNSDVASLHGTTKSAEMDVGDKVDIGTAHWDKDAEDSPYYTKVNGHKFSFQ